MHEQLGHTHQLLLHAFLVCCLVSPSLESSVQHIVSVRRGITSGAQLVCETSVHVSAPHTVSAHAHDMLQVKALER